MMMKGTSANWSSLFIFSMNQRPTTLSLAVDNTLCQERLTPIGEDEALDFNGAQVGPYKHWVWRLDHKITSRFIRKRNEKNGYKRWKDYFVWYYCASESISKSTKSTIGKWIKWLAGAVGWKWRWPGIASRAPGCMDAVGLRMMPFESKF